MASAQQLSALVATNCEVAFDAATRQLYATDASIYQVEPVAVGFPRSARQASALVLAAEEAGIPVIARGAGTGLVGGAIGPGLILDFSKHNRQITDLDLDRKSVRVGSGVVLDQLNAFLRPHGYCFGPDVATSSRATLGGMIANNSSGAYTAIYGTVSDHVRELEIVMADGKIVMVGAGHDTMRRQRELVEDIVYFHSLEIQGRIPSGLQKRCPGYALERLAKEPENLNHILCGSEGTLALLASAELNIVKLPVRKGLAVLFFDSVTEAMQATVELLDLEPAAIEHVDRALLDQTRGQLAFARARSLLDLDQRPCESLLLVEFFDDVQDKLAQMARKQLGTRKLILKNQRDADVIWALRKAGLSLLTGCKGAAKPTTGIEDTAVLPALLPEYVAELEDLMRGHGFQASYYGHACSGLLHVRPVVDLHSGQDVEKFNQLAAQVSQLIRRFKGSLAAEHGVGIARTEFMEEQVGPALLGAMREIKNSFDPHGLFNPGKIIPDGTYTFASNLRTAPDAPIELPFSPVLAFAQKDESFLANLEQCNGCGGCRKMAPSMCPTFPVTGDEALSTRGRANIIRAVLDGRFGPLQAALNGDDLNRALSSCLGCKACSTECPSNVNLALLKADLQHARIQSKGLTVKQRIFSAVDVLGALGCRMPWVANMFLVSPIVRTLVSKTLGISSHRPLPPYARQRFDKWFRKRQHRGIGARGRVFLWDDTFVRYHEPHIGAAATKVLEAAGYSVSLVEGRKCCGRPAFSQGHLDRAKELGQHNLALLSQDADEAPVIFLEPSCYTMFVDDYIELKLQGAAKISQRCFLFEDFIERLLTAEPDALEFKVKSGRIVIHAHCQLKSRMNPEFLKTLASRLPKREVTLLNTACCGMAGAFGMTEENYDLSLKVAEPLMHHVNAQPFGTAVVASGTSCRHQIDHLSRARAKHMAEVLAEALV